MPRRAAGPCASSRSASAGTAGRHRRGTRIRVSGWRLPRRPRHPERGAEIPGRHRIPAAAGVSVEPQQTRRLEGENRNTRHEAVGKARASGPDRIGDAVEMLSHHLQHLGHPQMPAEGFFVMFPPSFACFASQWTVPGKKSAKKGFGDQVTHCRIVKNKTGGNHRQKPRMACSRQ